MVQLGYQFKCRDKDGILVTCSKSQWRNYIILKHPEVMDCEDIIKRIISNPSGVWKNKSQPERVAIYEPIALPVPVSYPYVRVVIEYCEKKNKTVGYVINAFHCANIRKGDYLAWKRK